METQKAFERKDIVIRASEVPELTDGQKFDSRSEVPVVQGDSNAVIMMAIKNNFPPELIGKMMDLSERNDANEARKAHFKAVAAFNAEAPPVKKDKWNDWLKCWSTSLGNLLDTYRPYLGKHGLSISFNPPKQDENTMTVECLLSHELGHVTSVSMTGPIDKAAIGKQSGKPSRNPLQDLRSTFTYLRATTCEAILGVSGTEATADTDGNTSAGEPELISEDQVIEINDLITETNSRLTVFLKVAKAESVETILKSNYERLINQLNTKKSKMRQPGDE
jgi:hypothetical protein